LTLLESVIYNTPVEVNMLKHIKITSYLFQFICTEYIYIYLKTAFTE